MFTPKPQFQEAFNLRLVKPQIREVSLFNIVILSHFGRRHNMRFPLIKRKKRVSIIQIICRRSVV